jgi:hypothetical protein
MRTGRVLGSTGPPSRDIQAPASHDVHPCVGVVLPLDNNVELGPVLCASPATRRNYLFIHLDLTSATFAEG